MGLREGNTLVCGNGRKALGPLFISPHLDGLAAAEKDVLLLVEVGIGFLGPGRQRQYMLDGAGKDIDCVAFPKKTGAIGILLQDQYRVPAQASFFPPRDLQQHIRTQ